MKKRGIQVLLKYKAQVDIFQFKKNNKDRKKKILQDVSDMELIYVES